MKKTIENSPYYCSELTLALIPEPGENGMKTKIIESDRTFIHCRKSSHLLTATCKYFGSTIAVAQRHARYVLNNRQKLPILFAMNHGDPLIIIPTMSANSDQTIWIALHAIKNIYPGKAGTSLIQLTNDMTILVNASESTMFRQFSLAQILKLDYLARFQHLNTNGFSRPPFRI